MSKAIAGKKAAAFSAAFAIALSAGVVGADANVAHAQSEAPAATASTTADADQQQGNTSEAPTPLTSAPEKGNLTIHKLKGVESGDQGNGKENTKLTNKAVAGVGYKIERVMKLDTAKNWQDAAKITDAEKVTELDSSFEAREGFTGDNGELTFEGLERGLYKVTETSVPDAEVGDTGLVIAKPFLVYVPMTNPDYTAENGEDAWLKTVHAYPKNTEFKVEKTVNDKFANNQEDYTYTIASDVPVRKIDPVTKEAEKLTKYIITDELNENLDGKSSEVVGVYKEDPANFTPEQLGNHASKISTEDYTVNKPTDQKFEVEFTEKGRDNLNGVSKVYTVIKTKTVDGKTIYHVPNDAKLKVSHRPGGDHATEVPSNKVHTYWGNLKIVKQDGDTKKKLPNAEFEIVQCQAEGESWKQTAEAAEFVQGKNKWATDENGTVTIEGIHLTDFADNKNEDNKYCLKETKAPAGYVKSDALTPFELKKSEAKVNEKTGAPTVEILKTAEVDNYSDKNFLPNTGGAGFIAIVMAGLAIIGGGFFAARRNSVKA